MYLICRCIGSASSLNPCGSDWMGGETNSSTWDVQKFAPALTKCLTVELYDTIAKPLPCINMEFVERDHL